MHGAGIAQIFNMAIGEINCCGLIEIFPEKYMGFSEIIGNANIVKFLGMHYEKYQIESGGTNSQIGSTINIPTIINLIKNTISIITNKIICAHDIRDSVNHIIYSKNSLNHLL